MVSKKRFVPICGAANHPLQQTRRKRRAAERERYAVLGVTRETIEAAMHISKRLLLSAVFLGVPSLCAGQGGEFKNAMEEEEIASAMSRKHLVPVTSFGYIYATRHHSGRDKQEVRKLNVWEIDEEMSSFLRSRFKNDFANFPYEFVGSLEWSRNPRIGHLQCKIWLHGDSNPIAYHIECNLGAGNRPRVLYDATLGITSKDKASNDIQEALDRMVSKFARIFFRARG